MSRDVSIAELTPGTHADYPDLRGSENPLLWELALPDDVDAERIVVNMSRLQAINDAGFIVANFTEDYEVADEGEEEGASQAATEVSAVSCLDPFDSTMYIGKTFGRVNLNASFGKTALVHHLNQSELEEQVKRQVEAGVAPEVAWAMTYDEVMRRSIREGARRHLLGRTEDVPENYLNYAYGTPAGVVGSLAITLAGLPSSEALLVISSLLYGTAQAFPQINSRRQRTGPDEEVLPRRWSIFPFARQPDRYFLVNILSRRSGLIRALA